MGSLYLDETDTCPALANLDDGEVRDIFRSNFRLCDQGQVTSIVHSKQAHQETRTLN